MSSPLLPGHNPPHRAELHGQLDHSAREWASGESLPARSARQWIASLLDPGSFREMDRYLQSGDPLGFADSQPYSTRVARARQTTGSYEAVLTGAGRIDGRRCVIAVLDFGFLGGSMGSVVGEKITRALERAARERLPFITVTASGGARMQEGMLGLAQLAKTSAAVTRFQASGALMISVLTNPTTGGVLASFTAQADVLLAEPGALIGFAGPRVIRELTGQDLPPGFPDAEYLRDHGLIDEVVPQADLRDRLGALLRLSLRQSGPLEAPSVPGLSSKDQSPSVPRSAWETVQLARHPERPTALDYLGRILAEFIELRGDRATGDDPALIGGLGNLGGRHVVVLAQERGRGSTAAAHHQGRMGPAGYRKAQRLMNLAARLRLPLVTFIDTPGAELSVAAETGGLAFAISACLTRLATLPAPIVSVVIGEGGSGGAIALGLADRALMQENAIYSVIAPEGAAAILFRTATRAPEIAEALKLTAPDCLRLGVIDAIVPEPPGGAPRNHDLAALLVKNAIVCALAQLDGTSQTKLIAARYRKYRALGHWENGLHEAVREKAARIRHAVGETLNRLLRRRNHLGAAT